MLTTRCRPHIASIATPALIVRDRRRVFSRALLALSLAVGGLSGCDEASGAIEAEVDFEVELDTASSGAVQMGGDGAVVDVAAHTDGDELTAGEGSPAIRELRGESPEVCGALRTTGTIEAAIDWDRSAGSKVGVRIGLDRPEDAEVSLDVAVVVDGETMVELPRAAHLGPEMLARSAAAADQELRPVDVAVVLDAGKLGVDLGGLGAEHGMLALVAKVRRGDGEIEVARRPLFLFFAVSEAGVELVDEATGSARGLGRGTLSLEPALPEPGGAPADGRVGEGAFRAAATGREAIDREGVRFVSAKLCARHSVTYTDAGIAGGDEGTAMTAARRMTGADARVYAAGQKIWSGSLGDGTGDDAHGEGCTPFLWMPAGSVASMFYDTDTGSIGGNLLEVRAVGGSAPATFLGFSAIRQSGTYTETGVNTSSVYPAYLAIAKAMKAQRRNAGITVTASIEHRDGSSYDRVCEESRSAPAEATFSFATVHEYDHSFGEEVGDSDLVGCDWTPYHDAYRASCSSRA